MIHNYAINIKFFGTPSNLVCPETLEKWGFVAFSLSCIMRKQVNALLYAQ